MKIGIEIEFNVFKMPSRSLALEETPILEPIEFNNDSNLHSLVNDVDDFDQIFSKLREAGIHIEAIHKECSPGQFEIVLKYGEVFKTLDDYYLAREIIAQHFKKEKNQLVTFLPKPIESGMGNGAHVHISLWRDGKNYTGAKNAQYQITPEAKSFLAGILRNYDALLHFMSPSPNSLKRIQASSFVGAFKIWGIENKEAPLRTVIPLKTSEEGI
jgi:glutamine synthetase